MNTVSANNRILVPRRHTSVCSAKTKQTRKSRSLSTKKIILSTIIIISVLVALQMLTDTINYYKATSYITEGNYVEAGERFDRLEGFRDSETLKEYCEIMSEYDSKDFTSVYHSYRGLMNISDKLDNHRLSDHFIKSLTEIETLYNNYDLLLYVK